MVAVPFESLVRMHASSGTTGKSTLIFHTKKDLENWSTLVVRGLMPSAYVKPMSSEYDELRTFHRRDRASLRC